jgi:SNF2 family DNA or RNA helicase
MTSRIASSQRVLRPIFRDGLRRNPPEDLHVSEPVPLTESSLFDVLELPLLPPVEVRSHPRFEKPLQVGVREARLLTQSPWARPLGKIAMEVSTQGWRFPSPGEVLIPTQATPPLKLKTVEELPEIDDDFDKEIVRTRLRPPSDTVLFKDRLMYLLQPPLEDLFGGKQVQLPFPPYPYQIAGIAFLMPRHAALLADEMGLGKTAQIIISLRLLFHAGVIQRALVVCPKPLVVNWTRELRLWAEDVPFEVIGGDTQARKIAWYISKCPLKLVNYELLTRDAEFVNDEKLKFDIVVLDEAQRIKNRESKTAQVVRQIHRDRSWAMTGTPIENSTEDLVNIFSFVDDKRIPPETPAKFLPQFTSDCILRRVKEEVASDMPPKIIQDVLLELTSSQRDAYDLAERDGVIHLNEMGDTISIQHVFELVMRLKQICNFDARTGQSAKLEQLIADMAEVAASGRKAIIFSQWVEPLENIANELTQYGPLLYHGKIAHRDRQPILDRFKSDPSKHVILMSYGTGSVGLNLQFTNYVFLFDRWWNPAIEDQAINRAHRLGQKSQVYVKRFISQGTIEERIAEVLERKRQLFNDLIAQNGPPAALGLSEDDVFGLFNIKNRPRRQAA